MSGAKEQVAPQPSAPAKQHGRGGSSGLSRDAVVCPSFLREMPPVDNGRLAEGLARPALRSHAAGSSGSDGRNSNLRLPFLQRKLAVGAVDDPLEREADRAADAVMSAGSLRIDPKVTSSPEPEESRKRRGQQPPVATVRRQTDIGGDSGVAEAPAIVHQALRSPGRSLDTPVRLAMESRFGRDFSAVRVHTDPLAAKSAQAVDACAYTAGEHVVFAPGQYSPQMQHGQHLLAHELAHTLQQSPTVHRTPQSGKKKKGPPKFWDSLDSAAAEDTLFYHRPYYKTLKRLALAVDAGDKDEVTQLVNELVKLDGLDPASYTRIDDFTYELMSHVYLLDVPGAADKLRKHFEPDQKMNEADRSPFGQGRRVWGNLSEVAAAETKLKTIDDAGRTIDRSTLVFRAVRDEVLTLDQEAIRREVEYQRSLAQTGDISMSWVPDRGYSPAKYQGFLISLLQAHATILFKAYQKLLDKAIADLENGKGNDALQIAKAALAKIDEAVGKEEKNVGRITLPITKSKFGNRRDRHIDVFDTEAEAEQYPVAINYYSKETTEGWDRDMFLGRFLEIRNDQITFLERLYGGFVPADPKDKEQKKLGEDSAQNAALMKDRKFHLHNVDDWRVFLKDKLDSMVKANVSKDQAFIRLIELIGAYLKAFTYHTPYNIAEHGANYLTRRYPRALTGQLIHDCGIYALRTAYMLSLVGKELGLRIRFVLLPVHVGLLITGDGLPLVLFNNDEYKIIEHEDPTKMRDPDPERQKSYEQLHEDWQKSSAGLTVKHGTDDTQFLGDLAAAQFYDRVDVPFRFVDLPKWAKSKRDYFNFYQDLADIPVLADDKKAGITEFHTRYLELNEQLKGISNETALFWNDFLPNYWRKCKAREAEALKKGDRAGAEQAVNGFKKVVADHVAATRGKLDKLDEDRKKVSETLRAHPALVPKGATIAAGNLLVREMTFFDLLDKYSKLVEGLQAPQNPSLDAVKPWAFDPKMRFPYQE